jgi:soluble cytochrome b562
MNRDLAKSMVSIAMEYAGEIRAARDALPDCCATEKEVAHYRDGFDQVLEHLEGDILAPLLQEHPDLQPEGQPR